MWKILDWTINSTDEKFYSDTHNALELGHIEYFEIRLNVYEYILDKSFMREDLCLMKYDWVYPMERKIVNYNSLKVHADLKEGNYAYWLQEFVWKGSFWYSGH